MVTLQTADNALKTFYLDALTEQIDSKISPFLSMIEKTSAYVSGKGVTKVVRMGMNGGIGAGSETGVLPKARNNEYCTFTATLKNLYGTIEITDKAIRASANSEGAFVNLLNDEMQGLIKSAKFNFSRMLFGDGTGKIANILSGQNGNEMVVDSVQGFEEGMYIDFRSTFDNAIAFPEKRVLAVDYATNTVTVEGVELPDGEASNEFFLTLNGTPYNNELTGLGAIFGTEELYGVARTSSLMTPYKRTSVGEIGENDIQTAIDIIEGQSGGKINLILCSRGVRRALVSYCRENQIALPTMTVGENTTAHSFNGVPVVVDDFCPKGTMYLLNTDNFKLCQLCDWQWMEGEDGKVLKQVAGKPIYTATLVKYAELLCEKPNGQGMLSGITEA